MHMWKDMDRQLQDCMAVLTPNTALEHVLKSLFDEEKKDELAPWNLELQRCLPFFAVS